MASNELKSYEEKMTKSLASLDSDLNSIRIGRANPHVLDKLSVDYYGTQTPINQVGNITVPEARILQIQPWDASVLKLIEKCILQSDLGINPTNDGKVIRLVFPELTEERRKALAKDVKKKGEEAKVAIRNIRREAVDSIKAKEKKKELTEDDLKRLDQEMQKITDKFILDIDRIIDLKNREIMSI